MVVCISWKQCDKACIVSRDHLIQQLMWRQSLRFGAGVQCSVCQSMSGQRNCTGLPIRSLIELLTGHKAALPRAFHGSLQSKCTYTVPDIENTGYVRVKGPKSYRFAAVTRKDVSCSRYTDDTSPAPGKWLVRCINTPCHNSFVKGMFGKNGYQCNNGYHASSDIEK
jgi:hypothetical protein